MFFAFSVTYIVYNIFAALSILPLYLTAHLSIQYLLWVLSSGIFVNLLLTNPTFYYIISTVNIKTVTKRVVGSESLQRVDRWCEVGGEYPRMKITSELQPEVFRRVSRLPHVTAARIDGYVEIG